LPENDEDAVLKEEVVCDRSSEKVPKRAMGNMAARDRCGAMVVVLLWCTPAVKSFSAAAHLCMSVKTCMVHGQRGGATRPGADVHGIVHFKTRQRQGQCLVVDHKRAEPPARLRTEALPVLSSLPGATCTEDRTAGPGKDRPAGLLGGLRTREISLDGRLLSRPWQLLEVAVALIVVAGYFSTMRSLTHVSGVDPTCIETITRSVCYLYMS
jgi:hypothetical protein